MRKTDYNTVSQEMLMAEISKIQRADNKAISLAKERLNSLAKPPGSLGTLEEIAAKLSGITGKVYNHIEKKTVLVFAADNGVFEEGVAATPQSVTLMQSINLTRGKTGAAVLARHFGCDIQVCDVGIKADYSCDEIINRKIMHGTDNIAKGPAMTREDAIKAMAAGFELAFSCDADVIGIGEMGIANTTTSSAVLAGLTGRPVVEVTGRGAGLFDEAFNNKIKVIERALEINRPKPDDVIGVISKVGGLDIAAMCGAFLGAAASGKPVVIDGFISIVAALCAFRINADVRDYMFASHCSAEKGYTVAAEQMQLEPSLNLGMRLGEGSGCPVMFDIMETACTVINDMATFDEAEIDDEYLKDIPACK